MRNFYHSCKFFKLTIHFSEVWQTNLSLQSVSETLWISLNSFEQFNLVCHKNVMKTSFPDALEDILKTPWRYLKDVFARYLEEVLKKSWRRLEKVLKTSWGRMTKTSILIKTSWRRLLKAKTKDILKTSWRHFCQDKCLLGTKIGI